MQIADLFNSRTRDQAVQELPDHDLIVAAVTRTHTHPGELKNERLLTSDIVWLAMNAKSATTALSIIRQGLTTVRAADLYQALQRLVQYKPCVPYQPDRDALVAARAAEAAHIADQQHGRTILAELGRHEADLAVGYAMQSNIGLVQDMLPFIEDVSVLKRITECGRLISQKLVVARLWELGARDVVEGIANADEDYMFAKRGARKAAHEILEHVQHV